jgi:hypothetical protein
MKYQFNKHGLIKEVFTEIKVRPTIYLEPGKKYRIQYLDSSHYKVYEFLYIDEDGDYWVRLWDYGDKVYLSEPFPINKIAMEIRLSKGLVEPLD